MAIVIDLDVTGQGKVTSSLAKLSAQLEDLDKKLRTLGGGMRGGGGGRAVSGSRPGRGMNSPDPIVRFLNTPLGKMVGSTRLNLGKGSPLIGQMFRFLSPILAKLPGWLKIAAFGFIVVLKALTKAAEMALESFTRFRHLQDVTGGKNLAMGAAGAGALGQKPDEFAATVEKFVDNISSGGYAEGIAGRMGIRGAHDPMQRSKQDDLKVFFDAVGELRKKNFTEAQRFSRVSNTPELMQFYDMDEAHYKRMKDIAKITGSMTDSERQTLANFNGELGSFQSLLQRIIQLVGAPVLKFFTKVLEHWNAQLAIIVTVLDVVTDKWKLFMDWINKLLDQLPGGDQRKADREAEEQRRNAVTDRHTKAMEDHTKALNGREIHGGGEKARSAIPAAQRWNITGDAHWRQSYAMGLF